MRSFFKYVGLFIALSLVLGSCQSKGKAVKPPAFHWKLAGPIPDSSAGSKSIGLAGPVVGISNDRLIVGGGSNFPEGAPWEGGTKTYFDKVYSFKKENDSLLPLKQVAHLPQPVAYSANTTTKNGLILAGGENKDGPQSQVLRLNWDKTAKKVTIDTLPDLPQPLTNGMLTATANKLYFAGGATTDSVSDQLYTLDLGHSTDGWKSLSPIPHPVTNAVLYKIEGHNTPSLFLVGGRRHKPSGISELYDDVYEYKIDEDQWIKKSPLPYALSAHTGIAQDGTLLVFSGDKGKTFHKTEKLIKKINAENASAKKQNLIEAKTKLQKAHPGFGGTVLGYNIDEDTWNRIDSIPFPGQVTTTAVKWKDTVFIPGGEIRAGVRTPHIISGGPGN